MDSFSMRLGKFLFFFGKATITSQTTFIHIFYPLRDSNPRPLSQLVTHIRLGYKPFGLGKFNTSFGKSISSESKYGFFPLKGLLYIFGITRLRLSEVNIFFLLPHLGGNKKTYPYTVYFSSK